MRIALATAIAAWGRDDDLPPLLEACARAGVRAEALAWDDPTVSWGRFDAVLLRSTWDYTQRHAAFLDWCARVERVSHLFNPIQVVRWNTDKRYLLELAGRGVPIVPTSVLRPGDDPSRGEWPRAEFVVKPCIGAGARDAARFEADAHDAAALHAQRMLDRGESVLVQPYLDGVDGYGETALIHIAGKYTHAIRKGALLSARADASQALFAEESIQPRIATDAEHAVAEQALAALPDVPLYARVDLLPSATGPKLLELELVEPSLFFAASEDAADRLVSALIDRLHALKEQG